jgi:thiol-disulfide isomerase/thioredoxin
MKHATFVLLVMFLAFSSRCAQAAPTGLPADWSMVKELPAVPESPGIAPIPAEKLLLKVDNGWLVVRLESGDGELQWQAVLARATDAKPPVVKTNPELHSVDVQYGPYFARENFGRLRIYRERKTKGSPSWSVPKLVSVMRELFSAGNLRLARVSEWFWMTAGPTAEKPDVCVRFQHDSLRDTGCGVQNLENVLYYAFCGYEAKCCEEGDLLTCRRVSPYEAEAVLRKRKFKAEFANKPAPALDGGKWFNTPAPLSLEGLKGKVVLLDFWGKWCGPCVAKLPLSEQLYEKHKSQGLVVIGVHSASDHEALDEFLKKKAVTFPVVIDSGKTATRYFIEFWPTYFLIDRSGKPVSGFTSDPPTAERIAELLGGSAKGP